MVEVSKPAQGLSRIVKAFVENEKVLKSFLARYLARRQDIDDVVQETFLKAYKAGQKTEIQSPKAFLFQVAKNTALKELTRKSTLITGYIEDSVSPEVIEDTLSVEDQVDTRQKLTLFGRAVATLPKQCKRAFILRKVYGLSHKEIAGQLNLSVSTVEKHVANGLLRCSDYMRRNGYELDKNKRNIKAQKIVQSGAGGKRQ